MDLDRYQSTKQQEAVIEVHLDLDHNEQPI
jgi:hypothetical protein